MSGPAAAPDPWSEIRLLDVTTLPGANFWRRGPVTRIDIAPGAYDEISSADVPGVTDALLAAMPGLWEHRCSVGEPGGFVTRLRRGTYAPHIAEHAALELQAMAGHRVGYGRARGGDRPGQYTVVLAHRHSAVGRVAAEHALEVVRRAFGGRLRGVTDALEAIRSAADAPDRHPPPTTSIGLAVTGGRMRQPLVEELRSRGAAPVALDPAEILQRGLPYAHSAVAVIADDDPGRVPDRYRDADRAAQLLTVVGLAVPPAGFVLVPAGARALQDELREGGCRVGIFSGEPVAAQPDGADAAATVRDGRVWLERAGAVSELGSVRSDVPPSVQAAALLSIHLLEEAERGDDS